MNLKRQCKKKTALSKQTKKIHKRIFQNNKKNAPQERKRAVESGSDDISKTKKKNAPSHQDATISPMVFNFPSIRRLALICKESISIIIVI
jgi:hypothetical protein